RIEGRPDGDVRLQVRLDRHRVRRLRRRAGVPDLDVARRARDRARGVGAVALDAQPVEVDEVAGVVDGELPGAREVGAVAAVAGRALHLEEPATLEREVRRDARVRERALGDELLDRLEPRPEADLARAADDGLRERVLERGAAGLEADGVRVGDVVADDGELGRRGGEAGGAGGEGGEEAHGVSLRRFVRALAGAVQGWEISTTSGSFTCAPPTSSSVASPSNDTPETRPRDRAVGVTAVPSTAFAESATV